jgi:ethanolamine utilization protein EutQ
MKGCEKPMKNLITEKSIKDIIAQGGKTVCIDDNTLITPSARDMIRYNGLELTQGSAACEAAPYANSGAPAVTCSSCGDGLSSDMIYSALKKMTDQGMLNGFFDSAAPAAADAPYTAECANGFKLVRGGGIKMEVLELENPEDNGKVQYQELIGADVNSSMNAGFMTVDHCTFDWDVEPQEIYYVVEGNMTVTVDGVPHTASPGDCLFIQKGSKVVFSSGNTRCKVFYVTY